MKNLLRLYLLLLIPLSFIMESCIYEYPHPTGGNFPSIGENPTTINAVIEVSFDLSWENMFYNIDFSTRARTDSPHHFVVEVTNDFETLLHEEEFLTPEEFATGHLTHKLGMALKSERYNIAVWYDVADEDGNYSFDSSHLNNITIQKFSTTDADLMQCGFASTIMDLRDYDNFSDGIEISRSLDLNHCGARFEIVATDVQDFIAEKKEALNQGDKFSVKFDLTKGAYNTFNAYTWSCFNSDIEMSLSGPMRLPYADYEELKIAEGFFFTQNEDEAEGRLNIINSALSTVSQTEKFIFPVKRGYITTISGKFLTHPFGGIFSIDNVWEGVIEIEI